MKKILLAIFLLQSSLAFASGKIVFKPAHDYGQGKTKYQYGLAVHQMLAKRLAYQGYFSHGHHKGFEHEDYLKADSALVMYFARVETGLGYAAKYTKEAKKYDHEAYASISLKLW